MSTQISIFYFSPLVFILFLPLLFMFGWLPQADTFTTWFCEQLDMHLFGGTPATGLVCSLYSLGRSMAMVAVLWPLGWAAFNTLNVRVTSSTLNVGMNICPPLS